MSHWFNPRSPDQGTARPRGYRGAARSARPPVRRRQCSLSGRCRASRRRTAVEVSPRRRPSRRPSHPAGRPGGFEVVEQRPQGADVEDGTAPASPPAPPSGTAATSVLPPAVGANSSVVTAQDRCHSGLLQRVQPGPAEGVHDVMQYDRVQQVGVHRSSPTSSALAQALFCAPPRVAAPPSTGGTSEPHTPARAVPLPSPDRSTTESGQHGV